MDSSFYDWLFDLKAEPDLPEEFEELDLIQPLGLLFENWRNRLKGIEEPQQNKIVWRIIGYPLFVGDELIEDQRRPVEKRCELIRKMRHVTLAIPALHEPDHPMQNGYYMWWDSIASACKQTETKQTCFEVLRDLLENPDHRIRAAALHGLGHLSHPDRSATVANFMPRQPGLDHDPQWKQWLEQCRDGTAM